MKIVLQSFQQQAKIQQQLMDAMRILHKALRNMVEELEGSETDLDMDTSVLEVIQNILGKPEDEVQQMRRTDAFLDELLDSCLSEPYDEDFQHWTERVADNQKWVNTNKNNLVKFYDLLNPSKEFLDAILKDLQTELQNILKNPKRYNPIRLNAIEEYCPLLEKSQHPNFKGFSDSEKITLLCGPIPDFFTKHYYSENGYNMLSTKNIEQIIRKTTPTASANLPTILCNKQKTLYIAPHLTRFVFNPIQDDYDRAALRITAFTDALIATRDYLIEKDATKPFEPVQQTALRNFINVVNYWCNKTWPYCKSKLSKKQESLDEIIQIMQNVVQNFCLTDATRERAFTCDRIDKLCKENQETNKPDPIFNEYEYKVAFLELYLKFPYKLRNIFERIPESFTTENFCKLKDDKDFFDWVFIERSLGNTNADNETMYAIAANLDFNHHYFCTNNAAAAQSEKLKEEVETLLQKYKLLNSTEQLLTFANGFANKR